MIIKNPRGIFKDGKKLEDFMQRLSLDWLSTNYPAKNLYHYKGEYKPDNFRAIRFELFIHYYPDTDCYGFYYEDLKDNSEYLLKFFCPQFEEYFICCTVTD